MKKLKKLFKLVGIACLIVLASFGMGFSNAIFGRKTYMDSELKIEVVEDKREESEVEAEEEKN